MCECVGFVGFLQHSLDSDFVFEPFCEKFVESF